MQELQRAQTRTTLPLYWGRVKHAEVIRIDGKYPGDPLYGYISGIRPTMTPDQTFKDEHALRQYNLAKWLLIPDYIALYVSSVASTPKGLPGHTFSSEPRSMISASRAARHVMEQNVDDRIDLLVALLTGSFSGSVDHMPTNDVWTSELFRGDSGNDGEKPKAHFNCTHVNCLCFSRLRGHQACTRPSLARPS